MNGFTWKSLGRRVPRACAAGFVLLCVWRTLPAMPQSRVPADAAAEFNRALDHFRAGSYPQALQVLEPLERRRPAVAEIQHLLAIVLDLNRKPEEANRHFRRAVELQPDAAVLRTNFGASLMRLGQAAEAAEQFRKALELEADNPTASFNLGTILLQQGRPEQALPRLEKAYATQSDVYENAYQLAYCRFLLGKYAAADEVLQKLAGPAAPRAELRFLQALTDRALGRADRTREVLQAVKPLLNGRPQLQFQAALMLLSQDLPEPAEELLCRLWSSFRLPIRPVSTWPWLKKDWRSCPQPRARRTPPSASRKPARSICFWGTSWSPRKSRSRRSLIFSGGSPGTHAGKLLCFGPRIPDSLELGGRGASLFGRPRKPPDSWRMWVGAGAAATGLTRYEEATRAFLQAVKLKPEELGGYRLLAQTFDRSEEAFDDAAGAFRELLAREAANPWARYFEALATFQQASRSGDASRLASRAETLLALTRENPRFLEAHSAVGRDPIRVGRLDSFGRGAAAAIRLDAEHASAHYRLGLALQRSGRPQEARQRSNGIGS